VFSVWYRSIPPVSFPQSGDTELDVPGMACFILVDWWASLSCSSRQGPKDDQPGHTILAGEPAAMQRLSAFEKPAPGSSMSTSAWEEWQPRRKRRWAAP
jgi:hypothetical protein